MNILSLLKGIYWHDEILTVIPIVNEHSLLKDYVSSIFPEHIESEILKLQRFDEVLLFNPSNFQKEIMSAYDGYLFINSKPYIKVAGANDLAPSILFDYNERKMIIYHPSTYEFMDIHLEVVDVVKFLKDLYLLSDIIPLRTLEK